jgi:hypothetical protein
MDRLSPVSAVSVKRLAVRKRQKLQGKPETGMLPVGMILGGDG